MKMNTVSQKVFNISLPPMNETEMLDPSKLKFVNEYHYLKNLTIRLVELDKNGIYQNILAQDIKTENDGKDLIVTIRDAKFSDGTPITINDVYYSFKRAIIEGTPHADSRALFRGAKELKSLKQKISGLEILDSKTIKIGLNTKTKEIFYFFNLTDFSILHSSQYHKSNLKVSDWGVVTSGPYRLKRVGEKMMLFSNPHALNYSKSMPQKIILQKYENDKLLESIKNGSVDLGNLEFNQLLFAENELKNNPDFDVAGPSIDGVVKLSLNIEHKKFKSKKVRNWVYKRVVKELGIAENRFFSKANQYFLPQAKGHLKDLEIDSIFEDVNTESIPDELRGGITITTLKTLTKYVPEGFAKKLEAALGIPVTINFIWENSSYEEHLKKRDYEVFLMATSMSYEVIGETLNFNYLSQNPTYRDPTGNIKKWLSEYQSHENDTGEIDIIHKIILQIAEDSECIPLYYFASPYMFNNKHFDYSKLHLDESMQLWMLRVK